MTNQITDARDDAVLPLTRVVAVAVIPFLIAAFYILYLRPDETAERFAWHIGATMTAMYMGAGYLGGAWFFGRVLHEQRWHRLAAGFPPVAAYTTVMLVATLLHWETFDPAHWPFLVWLVIYIVTPVLVPVVWWLNRRRDPETPEAGDRVVPSWARRVVSLAGMALLALAAALFIAPAWVAGWWAWPLTPLTARVLAGWQALMGVGALMMGRESRWSGWRVPLQSILLWQALVVVAAFLPGDRFDPPGPLNWFTLYTFAGFVAAAGFYLWMERRDRDRP